jgi:hypothetical protein
MTGLLSNCKAEFQDDRPECMAYQNGKKYTLINTARHVVKSIFLEKCLPQKVGERRCDYLMHIDNEHLRRAIFIELKGGDLSGALKQLYSTVIFLKAEFKDHQMDARIVGSRDVPNFINIPAFKALTRVIQPTGGSIKRGTNNVYVDK